MKLMSDFERIIVLIKYHFTELRSHMVFKLVSIELFMSNALLNTVTNT